jgi:hypothetical protein
MQQFFTKVNIQQIYIIRVLKQVRLFFTYLINVKLISPLEFCYKFYVLFLFEKIKLICKILNKLLGENLIRKLVKITAKYPYKKPNLY